MKKPSQVDAIRFWRRKPTSVEQIESLSMEEKDKSFYLSINGKNSSEMEKKDYVSVCHALLKDLKSEETPDKFKAFLYEDDTSDYNIKFFLTIHFKDMTYLCVKGIMPFQQPNYKETVSLFDPFFKETK